MSKDLTFAEKEVIKSVVKYLSTAEETDNEIQTLLLDKDKMRASLYGRSPTGEGGGKGSASDSLGRAVIKLMRYEERIDERIDKLVSIREKIAGEIDMLENPAEREVMKRKYLLYQKIHTKYDKRQKKQVEGIADIMHYSVANVYKIHDRAALKLASMLNFGVPEKSRLK